MDLFTSAPPLSLASLALCAVVAIYSWAMAIYSFRPSMHAEVFRHARRVKRLLIAAFVIAVLAYVIGFTRLAAEVAKAPLETKTLLMARGIEQLLVSPVMCSLFAGLFGLTLLRARASYLKPDTDPPLK